MSDWITTRLKSLLTIPLSYGLNESAEDSNEEWPRYIRITDFDDNNKLSEESFKSLPMPIAQNALLQDGDLLLARSGATAGKTFIYSSLPKGACYAGYLIRARFNKKVVIPKYISYYTKGYDYENWKNRYCIQTTIQNISAEKYNQLPIILPPINIQRRIVEYLDTKTGEMDERIELLEKKRELQVRLKKAIVNQTITRGLDKNVKLKDSGVEWIGMIPEHWEVKRIKDVASINRATLSEDTSNSYQFKYIDISNVSSEGNISFGDDITFYEAPSRARRIIKEGDIIVSTVRTYLRAIAFIDFEATDVIVSTGFAVLTPNNDVESKYFAYSLRDCSIVDAICSQSTGVSYPAIAASRLASVDVILPPYEEQQTIAAYLDEKSAKIDAAIANIDKQIDVLKRLKRALINEVITGQRAI